MTDQRKPPAGPSAEDAAALLRWAGAPVDAGRAPDLAERLGRFRASLRTLERHVTRETEPIGLRVPPGEEGDDQRR